MAGSNGKPTSCTVLSLISSVFMQMATKAGRQAIRDQKSSEKVQALVKQVQDKVVKYKVAVFDPDQHGFTSKEEVKVLKNALLACELDLWELCEVCEYGPDGVRWVVRDMEGEEGEERDWDGDLGDFLETEKKEWTISAK